MEIELSNISIIKKLYTSKLSTIWLVKNTDTHKLSILKGYDLKSNCDDVSVRHIKSERDLLTDLHMWIKPMKDSNNIYLNYTLIEGLDLSKVFASLNLSNWSDERDFEVKLNLFKHIAKEVLMQIDHIHSLGYIYRDLKMNNIIINSSLMIKLIDYGLSKKINEDRTNTVCGTYHTMAPEMIEIRLFDKLSSYDNKVDLFSYGVFLYELFIGKPPFEYIYTYDKSKLESNYKQLMNGFDFKSSYLTEEKESSIKKNSKSKEILEAIDSINVIINNCLNVDPDKRMSSKEILKSDLFNNTINLDSLLKSDYIKRLVDQILDEGVDSEEPIDNDLFNNF